MSKKKLLWAVAGLIVTIVAISSYIVQTQSRPRPTFPDLQISRPALSSGENAHFILEQAGKVLDIKEEDFEIIKAVWNGDVVEEEAVRNLLERNKAPLTLFEKSFGHSNILVPPIISFGDEYSYLPDWKKLAQLYTVKVRQSTDPELERFQPLLELIKQGHKYQDAGGDMIHYLVGVATKSLAIREWTNALAKSGLTESDLARFSRQLAPYRANPSGVSNAMKLEFALGMTAIDDYTKGRSSFVQPTKDSAFFNKATGPLVFNRAETEELFAEAARAGMDSATRTFSDMPIHNFVAMVKSNSVKTLKDALKGNVNGRIFLSGLYPSYRKFFFRVCQEDFNISALEISIALRRYQLKKGKLPDTLDLLVPEYLPSIPSDRFDGKSIRYKADQKLLYSVGEDLIDSGGIEKNEKGETLDIVFPLHF